jgi:hypothetical protein
MMKCFQFCFNFGFDFNLGHYTEVHGLDPAALDAAAARVGRDLPQRDCLLVVKDGAGAYTRPLSGST